MKKQPFRVAHPRMSSYVSTPPPGVAGAETFHWSGLYLEDLRPSWLLLYWHYDFVVEDIISEKTVAKGAVASSSKHINWVIALDCKLPQISITD